MGLPYPNYYTKERVRFAFINGVLLPDCWRNMNSGVFIFTTVFRKVFEEVLGGVYLEYINDLRITDQCIIALTLHHIGNWQRCLNIQLTLNSYAIEYLYRIMKLNTSLFIGSQPLSLIMNAFVLHMSGSMENREYYFQKYKEILEIHNTQINMIYEDESYDSGIASELVLDHYHEFKHALKVNESKERTNL